MACVLQPLPKHQEGAVVLVEPSVVVVVVEIVVSVLVPPNRQPP